MRQLILLALKDPVMLLKSIMASRDCEIVLVFSWDKVNFHKKLGEDTAGTAAPNWPKGYSIPYDVMLSMQLEEVGWKGNCCSGTGWALGSGR